MGLARGGERNVDPFRRNRLNADAYCACRLAFTRLLVSAARFDEPFLQCAALRADRFQHNARLRRHEERQAAYDGQKNGAKAKHTSGLEAESGENGANAILRCDGEVAVVL